MDPELLKKFTESVRARKAFANGFAFASDYVKTVADASKMHRLPSLMPESKIDWDPYVKSRENSLVFRSEDMAAIGGKSATGSFGEIKTSALPEKTAMVIDFVLTSSRQDRDLDIILPKGVDVDLKMPLLWQHIAISPIGKYMETLSVTDDKIISRGAIADTILGQDVAFLIEFGALRISHAFIPSELEPISKESSGWKINKCSVVEASAVSIPSNVDAVILASSRQKLFHPAVKLWAGRYFEERQSLVTSGFTPPAINVTVNLDSKGFVKKEPDPEPKPEPAKTDPNDGGAKAPESMPLSDIAEAVAQAAKVPGLSAEAVSRIATLASLVSDAQASLKESAQVFADAAASEDVSKIGEALSGAVDGVVTLLAKVSSEIDVILGIADLPDGVKASLSDVKAAIESTIQSQIGLLSPSEPEESSESTMEAEKDASAPDSNASDVATDENGVNYSVSATNHAAELVGMIGEGKKIHPNVMAELVKACAEGDSSQSALAGSAAQAAA